MAIDELKQYQSDIDIKMKQLVDELAELGLDTISSVIQEIPEEETGQDMIMDKKSIMENDGIVSMSIELSGSKVLFIEFSAGVTFGQKDYPLDSGSGYGVGTYPGQTHAFDPGGWFYTDENGESKHSYGNRAYMPMYHARTEMCNQVLEIAQRIFDG